MWGVYVQAGFQASVCGCDRLTQASPRSPPTSHLLSAVCSGTQSAFPRQHSYVTFHSFPISAPFLSFYSIPLFLPCTWLFAFLLQFNVVSSSSSSCCPLLLVPTPARSNTPHYFRLPLGPVTPAHGDKCQPGHQTTLLRSLKSPRTTAVTRARHRLIQPSHSFTHISPHSSVSATGASSHQGTPQVPRLLLHYFKEHVLTMDNRSLLHTVQQWRRSRFSVRPFYLTILAVALMTALAWAKGQHQAQHVKTAAGGALRARDMTIMDEEVPTAPFLFRSPNTGHADHRHSVASSTMPKINAPSFAQIVLTKKPASFLTLPFTTAISRTRNPWPLYS